MTEKEGEGEGIAEERMNAIKIKNFAGAKVAYL